MNLEEYKGFVNHRPTISYFTARWCGPCKSISPLFDRMKDEAPNEITFLKIDVEKCPDISDFENIETLPTFFFFYNGHMISSFTGADEKKLIDSYNMFYARLSFDD